MTLWVRFRSQDGRVCCGALEAAGVREYSGDWFHDPLATDVVVPLAKATLLAPCVPTKIVALWNNFHALAAKLGKAAPTHPLYLIKPASCTAGPGEPITRPVGYAGKIAYEGELGIVIGRRCQAVTAAQASACIGGYTCVNDVTAADVLHENGDFAQWCRAKGFDTFGCLGPVIASDFDCVHGRVITRLDGAERQNYPLADMIFSPAELVSRISHDMTLLPGDVIACGTSLGTGSIRDGATVEVAIEGIGALTNTLAPEPAAQLPRAQRAAVA
jgi:2-keto-4-pentenoate hydratase/2-oxohepta-3-ene-1,7-dioic acid hydratase in catechol pathway